MYFTEKIQFQQYFLVGTLRRRHGVKRPRALLNLSIYWIYRVPDSAVGAKWLNSLIPKASINKSVSGFVDILIGCRDIDILARVPKIMRNVLRKWTPGEKCVKFQIFPTHFGLSLSLECSGEISRQSVKSTYPINSLKVDVFLRKSNARI